MVIVIKFFKDIYNKGNFKDYFKRNRLFFIVSICLILLSFFNGLNHIITDSTFTNIIFSPIDWNYTLNGNFPDNLIAYFVENIVYSLYTILMGLSFSILSILLVVANEVNMGYVFTNIHILNMINDVFVLVASFIVAKIEVRFISEVTTFKLENIVSRIRVPVKDLIMSLTIIFVMVLVISVTNALI